MSNEWKKSIIARMIILISRLTLDCRFNFVDDCFKKIFESIQERFVDTAVFGASHHFSSIKLRGESANGVKEWRQEGHRERRGIECGWIIRVRALFLKLPGRKFKDEDLIFASVKTHVGKGRNQRKLKKMSLLLLSTGSKSGREKEKEKIAELKLLLVMLSRAAYIVYNVAICRHKNRTGLIRLPNSIMRLY